MITAIWAEEKKGKTTLALTFPKPLRHFDLDVGGFDRAKHRFANESGIISKSYNAPVELKISMRNLGKVTGYRELWSDILTDLAEAFEDPNIKTVVIDSATKLWTICHRALLQEKQEAQSSTQPMREQLLPIEYGPANEAMSLIVFGARGAGKHLVLTHYPRSVYSTKLTEKGPVEYDTGEKDLDGFKQTKALADLVLRLDMAKSADGTIVPVAEITTSGLALELLGMRIENPTFDQIEARIKLVRGES